ncbi:hypothetical protein HYPSUDRAFT_134007 [Hypholoma sublateritium FD-334 SS-4]|uniref:RNase III domain-containing protein n=1 Tax=Hypholoma sublateritium (strain FD-334 SS-4) TaxID=945553 RepID=A0A0D2Q2S6_HYPSF|nr:hypothetical protein HYPSUDRAFT_134007 [Hypholoma sublateritium FD-334 SS-4]
MNSIPTTPVYPSGNSFATTLKRTRSVEGAPRKFDAFRIPLLPQINGDVALQVFTHISLRRPGASPANYGDNGRLADLGRNLFELVVTDILFRQRPMLQAVEISTLRGRILSNNIIEDWVSAYNLTPKLRCHPALHASLKTPKEMIHLFHAYVGGLYVSAGHQVVNDWIHGLLAPELERQRNIPNASPYTIPQVEAPPSKRVKNEAMDPIIPQSQPVHCKPEPGLPQPMRQPHQSMSILPNPLAPAQPNLPFLPLFNQAAMQRRVTVEYIAEFSGPSHAGRWAAKCVVNGICKGEGGGVSKQVAKEEAARKAYYSMGWT